MYLAFESEQLVTSPLMASVYPRMAIGSAGFAVAVAHPPASAGIAVSISPISTRILQNFDMDSPSKLSPISARPSGLSVAHSPCGCRPQCNRRTSRLISEVGGEFE